MLLHDFLPGPAVREFVRWYRIVHFSFDKQAAIPAKFYPPKPENCLHFFLRDPFYLGPSVDRRERQPAVLFSGQQSGCNVQHNGPDFLDVQVVFHPTAVFRLTGVSAAELANQFVDASLLFDRTVGDVWEQLQGAASYPALLARVEAFVLALVRQTPRRPRLGPPVHRLDALANRLATGAPQALEALAGEACLCPKQFHRKFYERVGVAPKLFARIARFNQAFNLKNGCPERDWLSIAVACGYYDYQHLAKDYRALTGSLPPALHMREGSSPERVLGLTDEVYRARNGHT